MNASRRSMFVWLTAIAVALPAPLIAAEDDEATAEIDYLLAEVGTSRCVFIRNGDEHDALAAREHLAMKRRRGRRYFDTAEEFIDRIASKSSLSKRPYQIRCGDETVTAKAWFTTRLEEYRSREAASPDLTPGT
jgi:hypothetical protein